jgi:hypothetical protein
MTERFTFITEAYNEGVRSFEPMNGYHNPYDYVDSYDEYMSFDVGHEDAYQAYHAE